MATDATVNAPASAEATTARRRRSHQKSRLGCRNCKLRRVKCDERRPRCVKCREFGVLCNFDTHVPDLQPAHHADPVFHVETSIHRPCVGGHDFLRETIHTRLCDDRSVPGRAGAPVRFDHADLARLDKFCARTSLTIGTRQASELFRAEMVRLACSHLFLMHFLQAVTAAHDRCLAGPGGAVAARSPVEMSHMNRGLQAFVYKLSRPIRHQDRDALFFAASLLGVVAMCGLEAASVDDIWPLGSSDLSWMSLSDGKRAVWQLTDPLREESVWRPIALHYGRDYLWGDKAEPKQPSVFDHLCDGPDPNPYCSTVWRLVPLLDLECGDATWVRFLGFICHMDPAYKALLARKDPWAAVLLAHWFAKLCRGPWWIRTRAIVQGQAICLYVARHGGHDPRLQEAIAGPRRDFADARRAEEADGQGCWIVG